MNFYYVHYTTYHNDTCIGTTTGTILTNEEPKEETILLNWDNLKEYYHNHGFFVSLIFGILKKVVWQVFIQIISSLKKMKEILKNGRKN